MRRRRNVFGKRERHIGRWIALVIVMALAVVSVYIALDNGRVVVLTQNVLVSDLPEALEGFTVLHISDLNGKRFGPSQKQIANALKGKRYNVVCMTGDMVGRRGDYYPFYELISVLDPTKPIYFIAGDMDPAAVSGGGANNLSVFAQWVTGARTRGAQFVDVPVSIAVGNATVWITDASQLSLDLEHAASAYATVSTPESGYYASVIEQTIYARERMREPDLHITLSHVPLKRETVGRIQQTLQAEGDDFLRSVDLILAGDTVGGQWRLPFIGPVWMNGWFPGASQSERYQYAGNLLQYISGGLGTSGTSPLPDIRLFNTAEMTLISFTSTMDLDVLP